MPKEPKARPKSSQKSGDTVTRNIVIGMVGLVVLILGLGAVFNNNSNETKTTQVASSIDNVKPAESEPLTPEISPEADYGIVFNNGSSPKISIWEDFQCPFCGQFEKTMGSYIEELARTGAAQVEYHMVSFLGQESVEAANASYCAVPEGRFFDFHKTLYQIQGAENSGLFTKANLIQVGEKLGIKSAQFQDCVTNGANGDNVKKVADSMGKFGVDSTPTIFINGQRWKPSTNTFNLDELKAAVEAAK